MHQPKRLVQVVVVQNLSHEQLVISSENYFYRRGSHLQLGQVDEEEGEGVQGEALDVGQVDHLEVERSQWGR